MSHKVVGSVVLALALVLLSAGGVLAAGADSAQAERLYNEVPISGTLTGSRAGAFAYFTVEYPGNDDVVAVELSVAPGDPAAMKGISLKIYSPTGAELGQATPVEDGLAVLYGDGTEATWTVQVANYLDGFTIAYSIVAKGLPTVEVPAAPATTAPAPTETPVAPPAEAPAPMSGTLTGSRSGAFVRFDLGYTADGSDMTVTLVYGPADPAMRRGVGLTVYGPDGRSWESQPVSAPGELVVTFSHSAPGMYEAVIFNYNDGATIHYTLSK